MTKLPKTRTDLAVGLEFPIPCGNCGEESIYRAGTLITHDHVVCPLCEASLDLTTKEWTTIRYKLRELCIGKYAPVAPVKQD